MLETDPLQGSPAPASGVRPDEAGERTRAEVRRLAQEFEAVLITQMMRDMRRAMLDETEERSEFDALSGTIDAELGRSLSASGGFGLTAALLGALERVANLTPAAPAGAAAPAGTVAPAAPASIALPDVPASVASGPPVPPATAEGTDSRVITSGFGWRRDPFTGAAGFHSGVDIRMAYGLDVRSVDGGQVRFAGEHGGYGTMVAVAHADGRETRYAHLAESLVQPGDVVQAGQVLGRSGSSGRATGPHLHFEVLMDGQRVDPLKARAQAGDGQAEE